MSAQNAALKLNGIFLGFINSFERFTDLSVDDRIFAEILPESGNHYPVACVLDENFFQNPPDFCDVTNFEGGSIVRFTSFPARTRELKVLRQQRFDDLLFTLYSDGELKLSVDGKENFTQTALPAEFADCEFARHTLRGHHFISVGAPTDRDTELLLFSETGEKVFANRVRAFSFSDTLHTTIAYADPARHTAETDWHWDGARFSMQKYSVSAQKEFVPENTPPALIPLLFFHEILVCGEPERYLCEELKPRVHELSDYLGRFVGVAAPPELFTLRHPDTIAAGLVYPKAANRFELRFFATPLQPQTNRITNLTPI